MLPARAAIAALILLLLLAGKDTRPANAAAATWPIDALPVGTVSSLRGDLDVLVRDLSTLMPQRSSGRYRHPKDGEAAQLRTGAALARRGELAGAARALAPLGFRVVEYRDRATNRTLVVLSQGRREWRESRAWGFYVLDPGGAARLAIEAPHPLADIKSERVAVAVFRRARAGALLVAGVHRYAVPKPPGAHALADAAHQPRSAFHAVHLALRARGVTTALQPHGFEASATASLDAIVSSGTAVPRAAARRVHERLALARFASCLYRAPACDQLGGTTNVQGRDMRAAGGAFVHVELALRVRSSAAARARAGAAIAAALRR